MKHTPGPWIFHENGDGSYSVLGEKLSEKEYRWVIGFIQNGEIHREQQKANARLMAASPEILEALQGILHHNNGLKEPYKISPSLISHVELAIKKAISE